jgi:hypothetical protein
VGPHVHLHVAHRKSFALARASGRGLGRGPRALLRRPPLSLTLSPRQTAGRGDRNVRGYLYVSVSFTFMVAS